VSFSATPTDGSSIPIPMSAVVPDGTRTPVALEGGPSLSSGGNTLAPVSVYIKDGNNITQGTSADAAGANTVVGQLKQINTNTASVSVGSMPTVTVGSLPALVAGSATIGGVNLVGPAATGDSAAQAGFAEVVIGLYNTSGNVIDRMRDAGSLGDQYTIGFPASGLMLFNGGSWDRWRTPTIFVTIQNIAVTAGSPVTMWTPGNGRKFHLQGFMISLSVAGYIVFYDNATEFIRTPEMLAHTGVVNPANFGNGYTSTAANNTLKMDVSASGNINGFVFGTAEF
jgi:hypothetical protein